MPSRADRVAVAAAAATAAAAPLPAPQAIPGPGTLKLADAASAEALQRAHAAVHKQAVQRNGETWEGEPRHAQATHASGTETQADVQRHTASDKREAPYPARPVLLPAVRGLDDA
jgi:hypothetical protein